MNRVTPTGIRFVYSRRPFPARLFLAVVVASVASTAHLLAQNETVNGNLSVTGTVDVDGNTLTFGTQSTSYGAGFIYSDSDTDTLSFHLNRSTASWLWAHSSAINAMRLNANHELVLYKADGSTAGITLSPASSTLSLGGTTLYRDGAGALATNAGLNVGGAFSATTFVASGGTITGGSNGLTINAGGTGNQNITLTPTGSGHTILNGNVGIGTTSPQSKLDVVGAGRFGGSSSAKVTIGGYNLSPGESGMWMAYDTTGNFAVLQSESPGVSYRDISLNPYGGYVGIGTSSPQGKLHIDAPSANGLLLTASGSYTSFAIGRSGPEGNFAMAAGNTHYNEIATAGDLVLRNMSEDLILGISNAFGAIRFSTGALQSETEKVTITNNGNVGIGTPTPTAKLALAGDAHVSGQMKVTGPILISAQGDLPMGAFTQGPQPTF